MKGRHAAQRSTYGFNIASSISPDHTATSALKPTLTGLLLLVSCRCNGSCPHGPNEPSMWIAICRSFCLISRPDGRNCCGEWSVQGRRLLRRDQSIAHGSLQRAWPQSKRRFNAPNYNQLLLVDGFDQVTENASCQRTRLIGRSREAGDYDGGSAPAGGDQGFVWLDTSHPRHDYVRDKAGRPAGHARRARMPRRRNLSPGPDRDAVANCFVIIDD